MLHNARLMMELQIQMNRAAVIVGVLALLGSACGSSAGTASRSSTRTSSSASAASTSATPIGSPAASPSGSPDTSFTVLPRQQPSGFVPKITCNGSIGASDPVAIVHLQSGDSVLRDYANPLSPRTACLFPDGAQQLIDARHVLIGGDADSVYAYAVVDLPEVHYHWFQLPHPPGSGVGLLAVSPGLNEISWVSNNDTTGGDRKVHVTTRSGDQVVALLPPALGRCGSASISKQGAYTHSGSHLYVLDQPLPDNVLIVLQGQQQVLSLVPPSGGWPAGAQPEMAVWSPTTETLFYRQKGDVWKWTAAGGVQRYLPGVNWYYPTFSASGNHLAYSVERSDGLHDTYLIDVAHGGSPQLIGKGPRNLPVFLNATQLLYRTEAPGICGPGGNLPIIFDITDGSETSSAIDQVFAVWPATSSQV